MTTMVVSHHRPEDNTAFHQQTNIMPLVPSHTFGAQNEMVNMSTHGGVGHHYHAHNQQQQQHHHQQQQHGYAPQGSRPHLPPLIFQQPNVLHSPLQNNHQQQMPLSPPVIQQMVTTPQVLTPMTAIAQSPGLGPSGFNPQAASYQPQGHMSGSFYYVNEWASSTQVMHHNYGPYITSPNSTIYSASPAPSELGTNLSSSSEYSCSEGGVRISGGKDGNNKDGNSKTSSGASNNSQAISRRKSPVIVDGSGLAEKQQQQKQHHRGQHQKMPKQPLSPTSSLALAVSRSKSSKATEEEEEEEDINCNVYIRGLAPTTTDQELRELVSKFGNLVSSKAIIDRPTSTCKGFGFAKFTTCKEAEKCIQGLKAKHYETGFARDSFNSKLKELSDLNSTNLYVSNLPATWTEEDINRLFDRYEIKSNRMLRNDQGDSRGVAFVRFPSRTVCDKLIDEFNGINLGVEGHFLPLQVRYADTVAQKRLKAEQKATHKANEAVKPATIYHHKVWTRKQVQFKGQITQSPLTPPSSPLDSPAKITEEVENVPEPSSEETTSS